MLACDDVGSSSPPSSPLPKYTVSFETDGGSAVPSVEVSKLSETITATKAASGGTTYYFGDWYTVDKATGHTGKTKYDYTQPVTGNMTLYARWYTEQPADKTALQGLITADSGDFNHIDVRKITDMNRLFQARGAFNGDITGWDVSGVTNMEFVFDSASAFNQPVGDWDVSGVTNMQNMFGGANAFDQDISGWTVSQVTNYRDIFVFGIIKEANKPPRFR
ncbi:BspA family leucine-rich repeat surface protein [Candidatus Haliotispira prima]|uniref:BspA family leucine-rich repeat surface protein n=1 Tax=Candidatus Haliotispira prima TaxID=3034016 RepID=A0ABY8MLH5_9SPIO|nr:BspA family leucine-rich repeat surface protein [Candidatus Haliotispira prima]